jgi:hypothetical protein
MPISPFGLPALPLLQRSNRNPTPCSRRFRATIRARMEELRREREGAQPAEGDLQRDQQTRCAVPKPCAGHPQKSAWGRGGSDNPP